MTNKTEEKPNKPYSSTSTADIDKDIGVAMLEK